MTDTTGTAAERIAAHPERYGRYGAMQDTTGTAAQEAKNQFFNALWRSRTYRSLAKVYGDDIATNACEDQFDNYTDRNERPTQVGVVAYAKSHLEATR